MISAPFFLSVLLLTTSAATAGTLHCSFTEPFFAVDFDSATGVVTFTSPDEADPETGAIEPRILAQGARLHRPDAWQHFPTLKLEAGGETLLEIRMSGRGSDGMSEMVFPWEGRYGRHVGGCQSDQAPAYNEYEALRDLGIE